MQYTKRQYLKTVAFTTSSFLIGNQSVNSGNWFSNKFKNNKEKVPGIPQSWIDLEGEVVYKYAHYILDLNLKNITPQMVIAPHFKKRGTVQNTLPPKEMWNKMKPTLLVIDALSESMGSPINDIVSAYRSPTYNRAVRGKSRSYHMSNQAVDVTFKKANPWRVAKAVRHLRDKEKEFKGGIGTYSGFVHIDTRGQNVNW